MKALRPILDVDGVIYFYMFICVALLVFNVAYIFRSKGAQRVNLRREDKWRRLLEGQVLLLKEGNVPSDRQQNYLRRHLQSTNELMAFNEVLNALKEEDGQQIQLLMQQNHQIFRDLAVYYHRKSAMERAFFAYIIAAYHPPVGAVHDPLVEILLSYMDNSTVYCRENVLNALYALGNEQAVEHAFGRLNDQGWYHNPRLLSDGMMRFSGDRAQLVERLWRHRRQWEEFLLVAVVQLATQLTEDFSALFLDALDEKTLPLEVRFALVRYFQRHPCLAAKPYLLDYVTASAGQENGLAIAAASALEKYPGEDTRQALKEALHSRDWYVRHNAAVSLTKLGFSQQELGELRSSGDRYAVEMLEYVAGSVTAI